MAKGNRALAQKMAKHIQQRRYGGTPRATWARDTTPGTFEARGYTMQSTKHEARETCARIALFAAHF